MWRVIASRLLKKSLESNRAIAKVARIAIIARIFKAAFQPVASDFKFWSRTAGAVMAIMQFRHCLILGFASEYKKSVRKFTTTYVRPIVRMQPCTR